ncbi:amidase [Pseudonocardia sp. Ae717_Ps2]|uniref:amidase family protein n=1 Tax=Pseudonocardia sp. Ae717_Ps2 TaxID=1885573 RepID=UPI000AAB9FBA|nr:amidase [Pseudonocardia sp. Ae717_Ps2]
MRQPQAALIRGDTATTHHTANKQAPAAVAIEQARRLDPALRAFLSIRLDTGAPPHPGDAAESPLDGLPITVKGERCARSPGVQGLLRAGAVPIGVTTVPRGRRGYQTWGYTDRGPTRNPWRSDLSPGGSSAGAAVAVAAGIVPLSCGSDGAGSVRIPAAWCHVIGFKPSTGRAPTSDPTGLAVPGVLVREPALLQPWAAAVLPDWSPQTAMSEPPLAAAAWSATLGFAGPHLDPEVAEIAERAAQALCARAGLALSRPGVHLTDPESAWMTLRSSTSSAAERRLAQRTRHDNNNRLAELLQNFDLLLTPTTPGRAHGHDGPGTHLSVALTWGINLSGHPAVSVPAGFTADGCPVGLQIIARPRGEELLLQFVEDHVPPAPIAPLAQQAMTNLEP